MTLTKEQHWMVNQHEARFREPRRRRSLEPEEFAAWTAALKDTGEKND